jgi:hypothetical protein
VRWAAAARSSGRVPTNSQRNRLSPMEWWMAPESTTTTGGSAESRVSARPNPAPASRTPSSSLVGIPNQSY